MTIQSKLNHTKGSSSKGKGRSSKGNEVEACSPSKFAPLFRKAAAPTATKIAQPQKKKSEAKALTKREILNKAMSEKKNPYFREDPIFRKWSRIMADHSKHLEGQGIVHDDSYEGGLVYCEHCQAHPTHARANDVRRRRKKNTGYPIFWAGYLSGYPIFGAGYLSGYPFFGLAILLAIGKIFLEKGLHQW